MSNKPITICIEGSDGAGKNTQTNLLLQVLNKNKIKTEMISCPFYECPTAYGITHIIRDDGVQNYNDGIRYVKAAAYAMNRAINIFDKSNEKLNDVLNNGGVMLCDRYTPSNILHIASILDTEEEVNECINFIEDLEYNKFKLPKPDIIIFLDVHPEVSLKNIDNRAIKSRNHL